MQKKIELTDYQLWMCMKIKERLAEENQPPLYPTEVEEREVISFALSEMLYKLGGLELQMRE